MIEAQDLVKRFGGRTAVGGVSFRIEPGSVTGFLGPNGAGKSTTMRLLAGALKPDGGRAFICGHDVARDPRRAGACLGYLPEAATGFAGLTVEELLTFCAEARGMRGRDRDIALARVLAALDLENARAERLETLSKGWRQRAWLAQAVIADPPVLVLDEPTDGLDPTQKVKLRGLIRTWSREKAILISTHILEEAEAMCDRAIVLAGGRVVADAAVSALADERGRLAVAFARLTGQAGGTSAAS